MKILLIYGGKSCEHDISVITACLARGYFSDTLYSAYHTQENKCYLVPNNFTPKQHKTADFQTEIAFLTGRGQVALLRKNKVRKILSVDLVVNCCHGSCGEDGAVAALCRLCNLPLVGSDIVPSAVAMDKIYTKNALAALNYPVVEGIALAKGYTADEFARVEQLGFPLILKPSTLGSSIGIALCHNSEELISGLQTAFEYDSRVLCEKALTNFYELNCAAMRVDGNVETSRVDRPFTTHDILTFQDKYQQNAKFAPTVEVDTELQRKVRQLTARIYRDFRFGGVVRVDYLVAQDGTLYVNEINSIPGSLAYGLWQHRYSPMQYGNILAQSALSQFQEEAKLVHSFSSGVLEGSFSKK